MRHVAVLLTIISMISFARPISSIPRLAETWEENQYIFPMVYDVPASLMPGGVTDLFIAGVPNGDLAMTLYLVGDGPDGAEVIASGPFQGEYNFAKSSASWDPDRSVITIYFQMPFCARYSGAEYSWFGSELVPVAWLSGDPSLEALEDIDSLLAIGHLNEATVKLGEMFYPGCYYDSGEMIVRFLRSAHEHGLDEYRTGDPEGAVQLFTEAEEALDFLFIRSPWYGAFEDSTAFSESDLAPFIFLDEFIQIANDYGFFLEQSGMYEEAVEVLYEVLKLDSLRTVAYLNFADALWGLGETSNAGAYYEIYREMMEEAGLRDQIPGRVGQRALSAIGPQ
ncbi:MAG: hypothetical protein JXR55_03005 [Candidatus Fermentibacteraceae bacterium]|nr:hypothetical protein [Candidatus Fermentibacteraceae bacterium]